jgi:hypothetical protein
MSVRSELRAPAAQFEARKAIDRSAAHRFFEKLEDRDLIAIFYLCEIGLLTAACLLIHFYPRFGAAIAAYFL